MPSRDVIDAGTKECSTPREKRGRRSKFTSEEDLVILREVAASKAHVAPYGKTMELFQVAADAANNNDVMSKKLTAKSIQDRFSRLIKDFEASDKRERSLSGIEGHFGEAEELLSLMKEARDDKEDEEKKIRQELKEADEAKMRAGDQILQMATSRAAIGRKRSGACFVDSDEEEDEQQGKTKRKRVAKARDEVFAGEMERFSDMLKDTENARLEFERERFSLELQEREKERIARANELERERQMRKEEREASQKLELDKFKLMLDVLKSQK